MEFVTLSVYYLLRILLEIIIRSIDVHEWKFILKTTKQKLSLLLLGNYLYEKLYKLCNETNDY